MAHRQRTKKGQIRKEVAALALRSSSLACSCPSPSVPPTDPRAGRASYDEGALRDCWALPLSALAAPSASLVRSPVIAAASDRKVKR